MVMMILKVMVPHVFHYCINLSYLGSRRDSYGYTDDRCMQSEKDRGTYSQRRAERDKTGQRKRRSKSGTDDDRGLCL